MRLTEFTRLII